MEAVPVNILYNVLARKEGTLYPDQHCILSAHYDSFSWTTSQVRAPGADDNASGVAAVLEAARVLSACDFPHSLLFLFFAGEEQGLVGSRAYAAEAASRGMKISWVPRTRVS